MFTVYAGVISAIYFIGEKVEEKAVVDQWLEFKVCHIDRCPSDKDKSTILKVENIKFLCNNTDLLRDQTDKKTKVF